MIERGAPRFEWGILASDEEENQPAIEDELFDEDEPDGDESEDEDEDENPGVAAAARG